MSITEALTLDATVTYTKGTSSLPGEAETDALARQVLDLSLPNRILTIVDPDTRLPAGHPAAGKGQVDGRPTAYV